MQVEPTSSAAAIRVVLGEDNLIAREGIGRLLAAMADVELVATCADLPTLEDAVARLEPDVVVTDVRMPPTGTDEGIRLAASLRASAPAVGVVVLTQVAEPSFALELFEDGTHGRAYLLKDRIVATDELARAVRAVADGGSLVDPKVVDVVLSARRHEVDSPVSHLTPRERETLALVAQGRSNSSIAQELGITRRAVERHINAIFAKLDLGDPARVDRRVAATLLYLADGSRD